MKKLIWIITICTTTFFACQQDNSVTPDLSVNDPSTTVQTQSAQNTLRVMSSIQDMDRLGFGTPSLFSRGVGFEMAGGIAGGRTLSTARINSDSETGEDDWEDDWGDEDDYECEWTTCATEEFTENADGSFTWTLDYGVDGCEEHGYFMKGKIVETYTEDGNTFSSTTEYIDFGDEEYTVNGTSTYSGTYEDPVETTDSLDWDYSGTYSFKENLTIAYADETYSVEAEGSESFDKNGFTSNEGFTNCTSSNGDFFQTVISTPLFYSYSCEQTTSVEYIFAFVSGVETTTYQETVEDGSTETGEFSIDYGDGTCDNIVTITENGVSETVDLGKEWEEDWDDEEDETENTAG